MCLEAAGYFDVRSERAFNACVVCSVLINHILINLFNCFPFTVELKNLVIVCLWIDGLIVESTCSSVVNFLVQHYCFFMQYRLIRHSNHYALAPSIVEREQPHFKEGITVQTTISPKVLIG